MKVMMRAIMSFLPGKMEEAVEESHEVELYGVMP